MHTSIKTNVLNEHESQMAKEILSNCVHCGFCNATCPTYRIIGDERDGPRGRIYLIKSLLEGKESSRQSLVHLDQCLTCRACETHCPSGVKYGSLIELGKQVAEKTIKRSLLESSKRYLLRKFLLSRYVFSGLLRIGRMIKPVLPNVFKKIIPDQHPSIETQHRSYARKVLLLEGCVQPAIQSSINQAARKIFDTLSIETINTQEACCGAISQHNNAEDEALAFMKKNIDYWWPQVERGIEAIISTASGCGVQLKDYAKYLHDDEEYNHKAERISELTKDVTEFILEQDLSLLSLQENKKTISIQTPCTLQHGQALPDILETLMKRLGYDSVTVNDRFLCCGSAGTYFLLEPKLANELRKQKLKSLNQEQAELIVTANVGCLHHLEAESEIPVRHWLELVVADTLDN